MNMGKSLNWGFLSTARINHALIPPLRDSSRNHLLAVASRSREKAQAFALENDIPRFYGSYDELLDDSDVEIIYNSLPNHLHKEWTVRALRSNKHVLCEKPFVLNLSEMDEIIQAAKETGLVATEAFMYRAHAQTHHVRSMIQSGQLGKIQVIKGAFTFFLSNPDDYRWNDSMGGGGLWDVGCYPVSFARTMLGTEPTEAFAWQQKHSSGIDITLTGNLRFPGDVFLQFDCGVQSIYRAEIEIVGSLGSLRVLRPFNPGPNPVLHYTDQDQQLQVIQLQGKETYVDEVEDMADAVLGYKPPTVTLEDSKANTRALLALFESAEKGKPVLL
jgi:predicted dehydrogenase